jgi:hypothetical protein
VELLGLERYALLGEIAIDHHHGLSGHLKKHVPREVSADALIKNGCLCLLDCSL